MPRSIKLYFDDMLGAAVAASAYLAMTDYEAFLGTREHVTPYCITWPFWEKRRRECQWLCEKPPRKSNGARSLDSAISLSMTTLASTTASYGM